MLKAATSATTDQGVFEAVISSASVDREGDVVDPQAMVRAMQKWVPTGKKLPLAWMHSTKAEHQVGYVDPETVRVIGKDVVASGWIDQDTDTGRHAWRLVKNGTLGFSFGYLTLKSTPREGKGRNLHEIDVFEITATTVPINAETRVLGWKSATVDEQRERADAIAREAERETVPVVVESAPAPIPEPTEEVPEIEAQREKAVAVDRQQRDERRLHEQDGLPDVPSEPVQPFEPDPGTEIPDTETQWEKAVRLDRQQVAERRNREERGLPDVPLAPKRKKKPEPELPESPDTTEQWQKAVDLEREHAHELETERRREEESRLPAIPEPDITPELDIEPPIPPDGKAQRHRANLVERENIEQRRRAEQGQIPDISPEPKLKPESEIKAPVIPDSETQRRRAAAYERATMMVEREAEAKRLEMKMTAEPFSTSKTSNWVARGGGLPHYIQHIAHDLMEKRGMSESQAIQMAIGICQRWARGGANVTEKTRAEAAAAIAEWEALKAKSKTKAFDPHERRDRQGRWTDSSTFAQRMSGGRTQRPEDLQRGPEVKIGPKEIKKARDLGIRDLSYAHEASGAPNTSAAREAMIRMASDVLGIAYDPTEEQVNQLADAYWEGVGKNRSGRGKALDANADPANVAEAPDTADLEALIEQMSPEKLLTLFETLYADASAQAHMANGHTSGKAMDPQMMADRMRAMADEMASGKTDPKEMVSRMRSMADEMTAMRMSSSKALRERADELERKMERETESKRLPDIPDGPTDEMLRIPSTEMDGLASGELKAVWSTSTVNDLPDSAFLLVESGGKKDSDGKTVPRSLRHFPYKDSSGNIDLPHLRNALARIPQSNLPPDVKDRLTAKAQKLLDAQTSTTKSFADGTDVPLDGRSVDPLRARAETVALANASGGESLRKPPPVKKVAPTPTPSLSLDELKQRSRDEMIKALSGVDEL